MINITDKSKCCGCNACVQVCPKACIAMHTDDEGFWYPEVDLNTCINCGLCEKVCPFIDSHNTTCQTLNGKAPIKTIAAKNRNESQQLDSSSGGLFPILGEYMLSKNGIVFGASYDAMWNVKHVAVSNKEDLKRLIGSKYVQSSIGNTFSEVERYLKDNRPVLFTGTPCQIKGLKRFLRKEYDNLLTSEIVCHGVPSPKIWECFKSEIGLNNNEISEINLRAKQNDGYNWQKYGLIVKDRNLRPIYSQNAKDTVYFQLFLSDLISRPSCYECVAKNGASHADITMGDYWGIQNELPEFFDAKGVSLLLVHSEKGLEVFRDIKDNLDYHIVNYNQAISHNPSYCRSVEVPKDRKKFWKVFRNTNNLGYSLRKAVYPSFIEMVITAIMNKFRLLILKK